MIKSNDMTYKFNSFSTDGITVNVQLTCTLKEFDEMNLFFKNQNKEKELLEYTVISRLKKNDFILEVNQKLNEGWELKGDISILQNSYENTIYTQTLIRKI